MNINQLYATEPTGLLNHLQEVINSIQDVEPLSGYIATLTSIMEGQDVSTRDVETFNVDGIEFKQTNGGLIGSHRLIELKQSDGIDILTADYSSAYPNIMLNCGVLSAEGVNEVKRLLKLKNEGDKEAKTTLVHLYGHSKEHCNLEGINTPVNIIIAILGQILIVELATTLLNQQEGSRLLKIETDGIYICRDLGDSVLPQWKDRTKVLASKYCAGEYPYTVERLHSLKLDNHGRKQYTFVDKSSQKHVVKDGNFELRLTADNVYTSIIKPSDLPSTVVRLITAQKGKRLQTTKELEQVPEPQRGDIFYYGSGVNGKGEASINDKYTYADIVGTNNNKHSVKMVLKHTNIICIDIDPKQFDGEESTELKALVKQLEQQTDGFVTYSMDKVNSVHVYTTIDKITLVVIDLINQIKDLSVVKDVETLGYKHTVDLLYINNRAGVKLKKTTPEYLAKLCVWLFEHEPEHCIYKGDTTSTSTSKVTKVPEQVFGYLYSIGIQVHNQQNRSSAYRFTCLANHSHDNASGSLFFDNQASEWRLNCHACTPSEKPENITKHNTYIKRIQDAIKIDSYEPNKAPFKQRSLVLDTRPTGQGKTYDMVQEIADTYDPNSVNHNRQAIIIVPTTNMVKVIRRELLKTKIVQQRDIVEFTKESKTVNKHYHYYVAGQTQQQAEAERLAKVKENKDKAKTVEPETTLIKPARIIIMLSTYLKVYTDTDTTYLIKYTDGIETNKYCNLPLINSLLAVAKTALIYIDEVDTVISSTSIFMKGLRFHDTKHKRDISSEAYYRLSEVEQNKILVLQKYAGLNNLLQQGQDNNEWSGQRTVETQGNQEARIYDVVSRKWKQNDNYNGFVVDTVYRLTRWSVDKSEGHSVRNQKLSVVYVHLARPLFSLIKTADRIKLISATISLEYLKVFNIVPTEHVQDKKTSIENIFEYYKDIIVVNSDTLGDKDLRKYFQSHEHDGGTLIVKGSKLSVESIKDSKAFAEGLSLLIEKSLNKHKETIGIATKQDLPDIVTYILQPDMRGSSLYGDYSTLVLATNRYSPLEELYDFGYLTLFLDNNINFNGLLKSTLLQTVGRLTRHTSSKNKRLVLLTPERQTTLNATAQQEFTNELHEYGRQAGAPLKYYKKHADYYTSLLPLKWNTMEVFLRLMNADNGYVWTDVQTDFVAWWTTLDKKEARKVLKQLRDYYSRSNQAELTVDKINAKLNELIY